MRRAIAYITMVIISLLAVACDGITVSTTSTTTSTVPGTAVPSSTLPPVVDCPGAGDFGEGGGIASVDGEGSDASHLGRVSWDTSEQCESFTFEFETSEGAPATTVPDIEMSHLESFQVIRIHMDIDASVLTDQLVETQLVDRLYVVRGVDGDMFVDLHLAAPAAARARVQSSPAQLTVDLRPGFVSFTGSAVVDDDVVVVSPPADATVDAVTQFLGYSRADDTEVTVVVTQGDTVVTETSTIPADAPGTWGEFRVEMGLPPGDVSVLFGRADAQDGSLSGITLDLRVS